MFRFQSVSVLFVRKQLKDLKRFKATGPDNLPPSLLKGAAGVSCGTLCYIVNLSIETSTFPTIWKIPRIVRIHKSGAMSQPENYRPISILQCYQKFWKELCINNFRHAWKVVIYYLNTNLVSDKVDQPRWQLPCSAIR